MVNNVLDAVTPAQHLPATIPMTAESQEPESAVAGFRIDKSQRKISYFDRAIRLTQREFKILMELVSDPGRVFTRQEILKQVWGPTVYVEGRTIDAHIVRIRRKMRRLGDDAPTIETVWALGYRFQD